MRAFRLPGAAGRARVGQLTARHVWREFVEGFRRVFQRRMTKDWITAAAVNAFYWAAPFLASGRRANPRQNGNRHSVDDAIRPFWQPAQWRCQLSIERVIRVGDKATGTTVLKELFTELGTSARHLDSLGKRWALSIATATSASTNPLRGRPSRFDHGPEIVVRFESG